MDHELPPESFETAGGTPRFLADAMLGRLARWLRVLGYDTVYDVSLSDPMLLRLARAEGRVLLTRDRALARSRAARTFFVRSPTLAEQIAQVLADLALHPDPAVSRCSLCNAPLRQVLPGEVVNRVPSYVLRTHRSFRDCPVCGRVYWEGTHWRNMMRVLADADAAPREAPAERE